MNNLKCYFLILKNKTHIFRKDISQKSGVRNIFNSRFRILFKDPIYM